MSTAYGDARPLPDLGKVGIWSRELRYQPDKGAIADAAAELEALGYGALFIPDVGGEVFESVERLLGATGSIAVVTGILNIWKHAPGEVCAGRARIERRWAGRFLLGLGASHAAVVDAVKPGTYQRPYEHLRTYLDALDGAEDAVPAGRRILAALGPRMLALARSRARGAHPYLVTADQTAAARALLGPDRLLAPQLAVALDRVPAQARERARTMLAAYLRLPNYVASFRRAGFGDADLDPITGPSAHMVDALVACGDEADVARRVRKHLAAGADHVCISVVGGIDDALPVDAWRRLAPALLE